MKQKIIKILYCSVAVVSFLLGIFLLIRPLSKISEYASYDTTNEVHLSTYGSVVKQNLFIEKDRVFRVMFFLNGGKKYDNLNVQLIDKEGKTILDTTLEEYQANAMFFEFEELEKNNNYIFKITDLDGDNIEVVTTKNTEDNYLINDNEKTLQLVTYYRENAYSYLWYPLFLLAVLYTIFPFVWEDKNEK